MKEKVFVIGAAGTIGSATSEALNQLGYDITALIHNNSNDFLNRNVTLVKGSLTDTTLIRKQLQVHDYLFIAINAGNNPNAIKNIEQDAVIAVIKIAEEVGIKKIVYVSGMYAKERFADHPSESAKVVVEKSLKEGNLVYTIFKPGFIDSTLQQFVQGKQIILLGNQPHPIHIVKIKELASNMAESFKMSETNNHAYMVTGRENAILLKDALEKYSAAFNPPLPVKVMPLWFMKILNRTILKGKLTRAIGTMSLMQKYGEIGDPKSYHDTFDN